MLFNESIFENVLNGYHGGHVDDLSEEQKENLVVNACVQADAHDFIQTLPDGYQTFVGERASLLSGGQKQRIAIARSLVSNPKILLLDEATSALDSESEKLVQKALENASRGRTTLVVAHRLSTIEKADNIVVLDKGRVVEQGTHASLLEQEGVYYRLLQAQMTTQEGEVVTARDVEGQNDLTRTDSCNTKPAEAVKLSQQWQSLDSDFISRRLGFLKCVLSVIGNTEGTLLFIIGGTIGACVAGAAMPIQAFLFSKLATIFQLTGPQRQDRADFWALMFFTIALTNLISYSALWFLFAIAGSKISKKYRAAYLKDLLSQEMAFFEVKGNSSGALTALLAADGDDLEIFFSMSLALLMVFSLDIFACGILAIAVGWRLGLVGVFGCFPVLFLAGYCRIKMDAGAQDRCASSFLESSRFSSEAVEAIKTVSSLSLEAKVLERYEGKLKKAVLRSTRNTLVSMIFFALSDCMDFVGEFSQIRVHVYWAHRTSNCTRLLVWRPACLSRKAIGGGILPYLHGRHLWWTRSGFHSWLQ